MWSTNNCTKKFKGYVKLKIEERRKSMIYNQIFKITPKSEF